MIEDFDDDDGDDLSGVHRSSTTALAPTVAVTLRQTGTLTNTTQPTATWTHTLGAGGGPQAAYQLKVFTAAQYGAGGFDPATSTATFDTGVVPSSDPALLLPSLPTGVSYRVYVRTAQLVAGALHWTVGYAFSAFTINVTAVAITLVATAVNSAGRVDLAATRTASPVWQTIEWQYSYDGGVTWLALRGYGNLTAPAGTTATAVDYEAPNGVAAQYRVRGSFVTGGFTIAGAWATATATWSDTSPACHVWLKDPQHLARNTYVEVAAMPVMLRDRTVGVFRPIGARYPGRGRRRAPGRQPGDDTDDRDARTDADRRHAAGRVRGRCVAAAARRRWPAGSGAAGNGVPPGVASRSPRRHRRCCRRRACGIST